MALDQGLYRPGLTRLPGAHQLFVGSNIGDKRDLKEALCNRQNGPRYLGNYSLWTSARSEYHYLARSVNGFFSRFWLVTRD